MAFGNCGGRPRRRPRGFTLIELLVVLVIIGVLLGTILTPLATQLRVRELREAERAMAEVRDALFGFAQSQRRLPCPDTDGDGLENVGCSGTNAEGGLPWQDLGLAPADRWGRLYRYRVTVEFTNASAPGFPPATPGQLDLTDSGDITVLGARDAGKNALTITTAAAAVVVSFGSNGHCGVTVDGNTVAGPDDGTWSCGGLGTAAAVDELENVDGDDTYVSRQRSEGAAPCDDDSGSAGPLCAFDDLLAWIPTPLLLGKLVEAGQLP